MTRDDAVKTLKAHCESLYTPDDVKRAIGVVLGTIPAAVPPDPTKVHVTRTCHITGEKDRLSVATAVQAIKAVDESTCRQSFTTETYANLLMAGSKISTASHTYERMP
jgi:hypothetical protein